MELKDIVDIILKVRAGAYFARNSRATRATSTSGPGRRRRAKLPDGAVLIPGVITQSHGRWSSTRSSIAERIVRFAGAVGRERDRGRDCGFGAFAGSQEIHESVVWAKFSAMVPRVRASPRSGCGGTVPSRGSDAQGRAPFAQENSPGSRRRA